MKITETKLNGVVIIEPIVFGDHRGFFMESYSKQELSAAGIDCDFIQDNHSLSALAGTIRGLHYQLEPMAQSKLIRVVSGAIYDVTVDIRRSSPTYGLWVGVILSEHNKKQMFIPKGFAHGFCTIVDHTQVIYKVDQYYSPEFDRGILWRDPELAIPWPSENPFLSDKDQEQPQFKEADINF